MAKKLEVIEYTIAGNDFCTSTTQIKNWLPLLFQLIQATTNVNARPFTFICPVSVSFAWVLRFRR